jgi:phosphoglycolate phosphatase
MIKHIIFDFDGTIADSGGLGLLIVNELAKKYHYQQFTMNELREINNIPVKERFKKIGIPLYKIPQMSIDGLIKYRRHVYSLKAYDGIKTLLKNLKNEGLNLSIISSNSVENIKVFLHNNGLEVFDNIVSNNNLFGKHKSIAKYLKDFNLKADEVIYIGDELRDLEACKKTAVKIISVAWGFDSPELLKSGDPDFIAYRPEDIMEIVKKLKEVSPHR